MVYCRIIVSSLVQGIFLVNHAMFEAVEQVVFFAACRVHFDRLMRLGRAAVSFEARFSFFHATVIAHNIDLHELAGFEAVSITIATAGICFVQRVGRSRLCGIHHAEVWHRRQQHRKCKQHCQQLLFQSSSCFHNSSYGFSFFISKKKAQERCLTLLSQKGLLGRASPVHVWLPRVFSRQP